MNATNFVWLLVGCGFGLMGSQVARSFRYQSRSAHREKVKSAIPTNDLRLNDSASDELRSLQDQLRETELAYSMAAQMSQFKGNFLARTSHELRSPLNGIIGMHQLILSDLADNVEEERDFLAQAHNAALRMVKLLDEVIDAAKIEHGTSNLEIQPTSITNLLQNVYSLAHLQAQNRTIQLEIEYPTEEIYVAADPRRLRQSVVSLVDAAIAHLEEGRIHIAIEAQPEAGQCFICINTPVPPDAWTANVTYSGSHDALPTSTLPKEILVKLAATPFPSTEFISAIAQALLQSMQGHLEIANALDSADSQQGSQLRCMIPLEPFEPSVD